MSHVVVNPEADLAPRSGDEQLASDVLEKLQLFQSLKRKPSFERFPNSVVLRHYRPGEVICRQGDAGASAYYVLTTEDLLALRQAQLARTPDEPPAALESQVAELSRQATALTDAPANDPRRQRASAHLLLAEGKAKVSRGLWGSLFGSSARPSAAKSPTSIAIDGPSAVDMSTRRAPLYEGEVFGEMSCMTMAPRSATVVADTECYLLEFLRNIFDHIQRDAGYQQRLDTIYRDRVLANHLKRLELLADVSDDDLAFLRDKAELARIEPGQIIFDQGDPPDAVYLIRSGMVQVVTDPHLSLRGDDVLDWPALAARLLEGEAKAAPATAGATPASAAPGAEPTARPSKAAEMLAAMKAKAEAKAAAPAPTPDAPATAEKPVAPTKPTPADIIAAAKAKKAAAAAATPSEAATPPAEAPKPAKPSAADMLAAARAKKAAAEATSPAPAATPADSADKPKPKSAAEMLAAAKSKTAAAEPVAASPIAHLWQSLDAATQQAVRAIIASPQSELAAEKAAIIQALNARLRDRQWLVAKPLAALLEHAEIASHTRTFPKGIKGLQKDWTDLEVRVAGRVLLELLLPATIKRRPDHSGPPRVLSYLSRGDIFGEMGVLTDVARTATCLAYDHPPDPTRSSVPVDLVRIPSEAFKTFVARCPVVQARVDAILRQRRAKDERRAAQPRYAANSVLAESAEFQELGLIQGQKLLLIDLDRCTRCGDCVRACVNTHDDGRSRLYLDGPRFDRYLVPSACRNCLNPACMIGCPVGSIQRGEDGQIEIRDWCIGCGMCADQCPYDSIQMHELGLVPNKSVGWRVAPAAIAGDGWMRPSFRDHAWSLCAAPMDWNVELQALLAMQGTLATSETLDASVCFRLAFAVDRDDLTSASRHEFSLVTQGSAAEVWLNGQPLMLESEEKRHRDKTKKNKGRWYEGMLPPGLLHAGQNVLAIRIAGPVAAGEGVLDVEIVPGAGELTIASGTAKVKEVTQRAVVCDLCSSLPTGPACVTMCPHDAAFRVDARAAFSGA